MKLHKIKRIAQLHCFIISMNQSRTNILKRIFIMYEQSTGQKLRCGLIMVRMWDSSKLEGTF